MADHSSLHPDILFHFTNKKSLFKILVETFKVSYSREKFTGLTQSVEFGAPMVSFCDLRLSELKTHMRKYGKYGIGLTKGWADNNGLNPVFYVNSSCQLIDDFILSVNSIYTELNNTTTEEQYFSVLKTYESIMNMYRYIKNYEGELVRKGLLSHKKYRFADEREWRYVPRSSNDLASFVPKEWLSTKQDKQYVNQLVSDYRLRFHADDIKYIIINNDNEISELISHLEKYKSHYDENTRRRLASRILTAEQIERDV